MKKKVTSGIMVALLLISMLTLAFSIQSVEAEPEFNNIPFTDSASRYTNVTVSEAKAMIDSNSSRALK